MQQKPNHSKANSLWNLCLKCGKGANTITSMCGRSPTPMPHHPLSFRTSVNICVVCSRRLEDPCACQPATRTLAIRTWRTQIRSGNGRQSNEAPQKCQRNCSILINQIVRIKCYKMATSAARETELNYKSLRRTTIHEMKSFFQRVRQLL